MTLPDIIILKKIEIWINLPNNRQALEINILSNKSSLVLYIRTNTIVIKELLVFPVYRRQGIATSIINYFEKISNNFKLNIKIQNIFNKNLWHFLLKQKWSKCKEELSMIYLYK